MDLFDLINKEILMFHFVANQIDFQSRTSQRQLIKLELFLRFVVKTIIIFFTKIIQIPYALPLKKTLLYCDPPYIARHTDYYNGWNTYDEKSLANLLFETKAKFILSTWHSNSFRANPFIESLWNDFHIFTHEHFYHVGAKEINRNPMLEALVMNFSDNNLCLGTKF